MLYYSLKRTMPNKPNSSVKKATKKAETPKDEDLEQVLKDFKSSWDYCAGSWHDRWTNNYKLYHNERVKRGYEGITDTFVPMAFGTVETKTSALYGAKPKFMFLAPRNKPDQKTDILNALLDHYWEKDQWSVKVINTGRTKLQLGNGIDYFYWNGDHPCMLNVPLRDFFIDATCFSGEDARYMGRRYLTTKKELEEYEIVDFDSPTEDINPETGEVSQSYGMKKKYTNLDQNWKYRQAYPTKAREQARKRPTSRKRTTCMAQHSATTKTRLKSLSTGQKTKLSPSLTDVS
jgi:hypothetical protein